MRLSAFRMILSAAALALMTAAAPAQDFHGFSPTGFNGEMLSADQLAAAVVDAIKQTPPKNGNKYVIGFANLQRDISFCAKVEQGILENAKAAGIDVVVADNRLDGATALANAESFISPRRRLRDRIPDRRQFRRHDHAEDERRRDQGHRHRHSDAGRDLLRRQQSEVGLHGRRLSRPGGDQEVRRRQGQGRLLHPR